MSDADASEAYEALIHILRANNLEWLADQINDEVVLGKIKSERIAVTSESALFDATHDAIDSVSRLSVSRLPKAPRAEFLARAEYSALEKFEIAVGAIRAVIVGAVRIQDALSETLKAANADISFEPGETGDKRHSFRSNDLAAHRIAVSNLDQLLNELSEDVNK